MPIHFADPLVRRAPSLQQTADARPPQARMNALTLAQLGVAEGAQVKVTQGRGEAVLDGRRRRRGAGRAWSASPPRTRRPAASRACPGPITVERA